MKRSLFLATTIALISMNVSADYVIKYKVEPEPRSIILRDMTNNLPEPHWVSILPNYTSWANVGNLYDCSNWNPDASTVIVGASFTQNATDCKLNQSRSVQNREQETRTLEIRNVGAPIIESNTLTDQNNSRSAIGTLENWIAYSSVYGSWVNSGSIYDCTNWSPSPSTIVLDVPFTQTATDCKLNQTRTAQAREQETTTLSIRNVGSPTVENQTLATETSTRSSVGTLVVEDCRYSASGTKSYWQEHRSATNNPYLTIYFENVTIANQSTAVSPKTVGGYLYTRGNLVTSSGTGIGYVAKYYICRKKV